MNVAHLRPDARVKCCIRASLCYFLPMDGPRQLKAWLDAKGGTREQRAADLRVHVTTLYRWLAGNKQPNLNQAAHMQDVAGIPATAWAEPVKEKSQ